MAHGVNQILAASKTAAKTVVKRLGAAGKNGLAYRKSANVSATTAAAAAAGGGAMASRRIFAPAFKLKVLDSYRNDIDCRGNQRATARKYGIHRRQIQKWLQGERNLRINLAEGSNSGAERSGPAGAAAAAVVSRSPQAALRLHAASGAEQSTATALNFNRAAARLHGDELAVQQPPPPPPAPSAAAPSSIASAAAAAAAAQALAAAQQQLHQHHLQQQQQQQQHANYRFHAAAPTSAPPSGYPDFKDKLLVPRHENRDYMMLDLYQPLAAYHHHHQQHQQQQQQHHHRAYNLGFGETSDTQAHLASPLRYAQQQQQRRVFETKVDVLSPSSTSSSSSSASSTHESEACHYPERRCESTTSSSMNLFAPTEIKSEPASPDSATVLPSPVPCEATTSGAPSTDVALPATTEVDDLKREPIEEEEHLQQQQPDYSRDAGDYQQRSPSPVPSHPDHLESLPPSPRDSLRSLASFSSSLSSSDSEMDCSSGRVRTKPPHRRSFSLRFKLDVLDAFHKDAGVAGNQRATARKFGVNRRQVQKWLIQEADLRDLIELYGSSNRQRLGPVQESIAGACPSTEESPVDLRTSGAEFTHQHPSGPLAHYPGGYCPEYVDSSSLTPPYSTPGCSLSCCQDLPSGNATGPQHQQYYCFSPGDVSSSSSSNSNNGSCVNGHLGSAKRSLCTQSCCYPDAPVQPAKSACRLEDKLDMDAEEEEDDETEQPVQDSPLCLVKARRVDEGEQVSSTVPSPPLSTASSAGSPVAAAATATAKKDAILFKPYLDNPVSKPSGVENNNCQDACDLNEVGFRMPVVYRPSQQQQQQLPIQQVDYQSPYLESFPHQARSAFVRYPASVVSAHYS